MHILRRLSVTFKPRHHLMHILIGKRRIIWLYYYLYILNILHTEYTVLIKWTITKRYMFSLYVLIVVILGRCCCYCVWQFKKWSCTLFCNFLLICIILLICFLNCNIALEKCCSANYRLWKIILLFRVCNYFPCAKTFVDILSKNSAHDIYFGLFSEAYIFVESTDTGIF